MRRILIVVLVLAATLMSCSSPAEKIKGEWEIVSIGKGKVVQATDEDYKVANEMMRGLRYKFSNDSLFMNDSLVGLYEIDSTAIVFVGKMGNRDEYSFEVTRDSLRIENDIFIVNFGRVER